jgi:hypothetical protein
MTFSVPQSKKSLKQNRFEFAGVDGEKHELPLLKFVSAGSAEAMEMGQNVHGLMLAADTDRTRDMLRSLDGDQLEALMEAWGKASGISMGESQGSSDS